jgi:hypothetical protein
VATELITPLVKPSATQQAGVNADSASALTHKIMLIPLQHCQEVFEIFLKRR